MQGIGYWNSSKILYSYEYEYIADNNVVHRFIDSSTLNPIIADQSPGQQLTVIDREVSIPVGYPPMSIEYDAFIYDEPIVNYSNIYINGVTSFQNFSPATNMEIRQPIGIVFDDLLRVRNVEFSISTLGTGTNVVAFANYSNYDKRIVVTYYDSPFTLMTSPANTVTVIDNGPTSVTDPNASFRIQHVENSPSETVRTVVFNAGVPQYVGSNIGTGGAAGTFSGDPIHIGPTPWNYPIVVITM